MGSGRQPSTRPPRPGGDRSGRRRPRLGRDVWELTIKEMLGKLALPEMFAHQLAEQGLVLLNISAAHAEGAREFPDLLRHDPFDRLIVAQAHREGLDLITADRVLLALGQDFIIDAGA